MTKPFLPPKDTDADGASARDMDRDSLFLQADADIVGKANGLRIRVRNLSAGGLMAEAPVEVERGDTVILTLRNIGQVVGKVAWTAEGRFGVAFDQPIEPKHVRQPVAHADTRPSFLRKLDAMGRPRGRNPI